MSSEEMVLVDTSIWADHIDHADKKLEILLQGNKVLIHPYVIGELAMGNLRRRKETLGALQLLGRVSVATDEEILQFIVTHTLFGRGIGYVDAHLLASVQMTGRARLWTRDRRLREAAENLGVDFKP